MPAEEFERARPGERGATGFVGIALVAVEPMPRGISEDVQLGMLGCELAHLLNGDMRILLAEMQFRWNLRLQVLHGEDPPAVVADRRVQAREPRRRRPSHRSAEAVADDPNLAGFLRGPDGGG